MESVPCHPVEDYSAFQLSSTHVILQSVPQGFCLGESRICVDLEDSSHLSLGKPRFFTPTSCFLAEPEVYELGSVHHAFSPMFLNPEYVTVWGDWRSFSSEQQCHVHLMVLALWPVVWFQLPSPLEFSFPACFRTWLYSHITIHSMSLWDFCFPVHWPFAYDRVNLSCL